MDSFRNIYHVLHRKSNSSQDALFSAPRGTPRQATPFVKDFLLLSETGAELVSRFQIYHIAAGKKNEVKLKMQSD